MILCKGTMAERPYRMPFTEYEVYSLEELCYYIYHNIYTITEEFFEPPLAAWLREQTDHPVLANKIEKMLGAGETLKNFVVTLLCGCDYYREDEIRQIILVMDEIENLPLYQKKKIKADNFLRAGKYGRSLLEYRKLLYGSFAVNFTTEEIGNILHNQGIACFYTSSFEEAAQNFKEAYSKNNRRESLEHYLWVLLIDGREEDCGMEAEGAGLSPEELQEIKKRLAEAKRSCRIPGEREMDLETCKNKLRMAFASK